MTHLKRGEKPGTVAKPRSNKYGFEVVDVECTEQPTKHTGEVLLTAWTAKNGEGFECHRHTQDPTNLNRGCKKKDECFGTMRPMKARK